MGIPVLWGLPLDLEFFRFIMIFKTSSGDKALNCMDHFLLAIASLNLAKGSEFTVGIVCLSPGTFSMKNSFILRANPDGVLMILPA